MNRTFDFAVYTEGWAVQVGLTAEAGWREFIRECNVQKDMHVELRRGDVIIAEQSARRKAEG